MKPENNHKAADIFKQIDHYKNLIELAKSISIDVTGKGWMGCIPQINKIHDLNKEAGLVQNKVIKKIRENITALENELKGL